MDDVARAVGAGTGKTVTIDGVTCSIRPLGIRDLTEVQRVCLRQYRTKYLQHQHDDIASGFLSREDFNKLREETAKWDLDDLPTKWVYDTSVIPMAPGLRTWLKKNIPNVTDKLLKEELWFQRLVATSLDSEQLTTERYKEITGKEPVRMKTGYANWWITGCLDGFITIIHQMVKDKLSLERVEKVFNVDPTAAAMLAREIESVTTPDLGNGQD